MLKSTRDHIRAAQQVGAKVVAITPTGSCHVKLTVTSAGKRRFFICATSASDLRALQNFKAQVKRWVRETTPTTKEAT